MAIAIEGLENRTLFTTAGVVAAETALLADVGHLRTDLRSFVTTYHADVKLLAADAKTLPRTKASAKLIAHAKTDLSRTMTAVHAALGKLVAADQVNATRVEKAAIAVFLQPSNLKAQAALAAAITKVESAGAVPLTKLESALSTGDTKLNADLDAIVAANPSSTVFDQGVSTIKADSASASTTLNADITQSQSDLASLVTALST